MLIQLHPTSYTLDPEFSIHHPPYPQRVAVLQGGREEGIGNVLVGDRSGEATYGAGSHRGGGGRGGGRVWPAVDHGVADLDAGGIAIEDQAAHAGLQDGGD